MKHSPLLILAYTTSTTLGQTEPISGGAGWLGAGLLGMVLAWLLLKHLPAKDAQIQAFVETKDKQVAAVLAGNTVDRDQDRKTREELASVFQKTLAEMEKIHRDDAEKDRAAFVQRNTQVVDAIRIQTGELKAAIASSCRFAGAVVEVKKE